MRTMSRVVVRKVDHRRGVRQLVVPVLQGGVERRSREPCSLPCGVVRVLERQLRQGLGEGVRRHVGVRGRGTVQEVELPLEDTHRPAVGDDVMDGDEQDMMVILGAEEAGSPQRSLREVERSAVSLGDGVGQTGPIRLHGCHGDRGRRVHNLAALPVHLREGRPQRLVAALQRRQGPVERGDVQPAPDLEGESGVVVGAAGLHLVQQPQTLLGVGKFQRTRARHDGYVVLSPCAVLESAHNLLLQSGPMAVCRLAHVPASW